MTGARESDVERVASAVVEQALAVVALGGDLPEVLAARQIVRALESGAFCITEGTPADGGTPLARILGRTPTASELTAIHQAALIYARIVVAWHETHPVPA